MAKALFGHIATPTNVRLLDEVSRLRQRVHELEEQLAAARAENDRLATDLVADDDILGLTKLEHAGL